MVFYNFNYAKLCKNSNLNSHDKKITPFFMIFKFR